MFGDLEALQGIVGDNILLIVFLVGIVWFVLTKLAESLDLVARILGPWGRRIRAAKERRDEDHRKEVRKEAQRVLAETGNLEPPDYQAVKQRLSNVLEEVGAQNTTIREIQLENRGLRTYILEDEDWHWEDARSAQREDRVLRPRTNFDEYMAEFMRRNTRQNYHG